MCQPDQLQCVKEVTILDKKCLKSCEGLYVTSYFKSKLGEDLFADFWSKVQADYMKYKGRKAVNYPDDMKGLRFKAKV